MATCKECLHYEACKYWIDTFKEQIRHDWEYVFADNCNDFKDKTKYVEQKHGRWEAHPLAYGFERCSECRDCNIWGEWADGKKWNYCPHCGAKMDGD